MGATEFRASDARRHRRIRGAHELGGLDLIFPSACVPSKAQSVTVPSVSPRSRREKAIKVKGRIFLDCVDWAFPTRPDLLFLTLPRRNMPVVSSLRRTQLLGVA